MNPDELFVISAIKRSEISEELNGCLSDDREDWDEWETGEVIASDDPRLTKEFCQEYADALHQSDCDFPGEDEAGALYHELAQRMRERLLTGK